MSFLEGMITPKIGLGLIKNEIQKQTKIKVKDFKIVYVKLYENMKFLVTDNEENQHSFEFKDEGDKLSTIVQGILKNQLEHEITIDAFIVSYLNKEISSEIYFKDEAGKKQILTQKL